MAPTGVERGAQISARKCRDSVRGDRTNERRRGANLGQCCRGQQSNLDHAFGAKVRDCWGGTNVDINQICGASDSLPVGSRGERSAFERRFIAAKNVEEAGGERQ